MGLIPGIQESSGHTRNTAAPADTKMMLTTVQRLALTLVQRWLGMIVYDTDLVGWKKLITNPVGDTTTETDWEDFGTGSDNFSYKKVDIGEIIIIPENQQMLYVGALQIDGELQVNGEAYELAG